MLALRRARRPPVPPVVDPAVAPTLQPVTVSTRPPTDRLKRHPTIQGRTALLDRLSASLRQAGKRAGSPRVHVLHGLGGCGKSTVALALARWAEQQGTHVWWISASEPGLFLASMHAVAMELGIGVEQLSSGSLPDQVWSHLTRWERQWLLVIDNADDVHGLLALPDSAVTDGDGWLRPVTSRYGAIVVTTRDGRGEHWPPGESPWFQLHPVGVLAPDDGARVLLDVAGDTAGDHHAARRLSVRLGGLPLALRLAGRHLKESIAMPASFADPDGVTTFDDYIAVLDQGQHREFLDGAAGPDRQHRMLVGRTWEISLDLLAASGAPESRQVLRLLSCLRQAPIPLSLLRADVMAASPLLAGITALRLWRLIDELVGVALLDRQQMGDDDPVLVMHPLVRDVSRQQDDLDSDDMAYLMLLAALLVDAVKELDPKHPSSWARWSALAEHCAAPLDLVTDRRRSDVDDAAVLLEPALRAAGYLRAAGHPHRADVECRSALDVGRQILRRDHPIVLALRHEQCRSWYDAGRYQDAKRALHEVLEARGLVLGRDHPDTATTAHYLGRILLDDGQTDHAERYFSRALDARRRVLGERHRDTLTSLNNIAAVHLAKASRDGQQPDQQRLALAESLLRHVLAARRETLGEKHPATLVTHQHLARLAMLQGEFAAAEAILKRLAVTSAAILGPHHRRTLEARQLMADVQHFLGDADAAEATTREVMQIRTRLLGPDHPATITSRHRLALLLRERGDSGEARTLLTAVVAGRRAVLSPGHPATHRAIVDLDDLGRG
ncbi:tetratricopeptide repeat protein [Micromonospora parva]|uniref:tetratricopeptide repeat protein n=1 Tax=Micromonospora parva TaxID=1464048 RepID=UPI0033C49A93